MSFMVIETVFNGYRCGCCHQSWDRETKWFEDREKALAEVTLEIPPTDDEGGGLEIVSVVDGSTGEQIARASLKWPSGYRGAGYQGTLWSGWVDPGGGAPMVDIHAFKGSGSSWGECLAKVEAEARAQKRRKAERQLEQAQKVLKRIDAEEKK